MTFASREASVALGAPLEAYEFTCGALTVRETSGDAIVTVAGHDYEPAAIARGEIDLSGEDEQGELELTVPRTHTIAALFIAGLPSQPVQLTVYAGHRGDAEWVTAWTGEISGCAFQDSSATLTGLPASHRLREQIPGACFQSCCNWALFSARCGLTRGDFAVAGVVTCVDGLEVSADEFDAEADGYFVGGQLEDAVGEIHMVTAHVGDTLTLLTPFRSLAVGANVNAYPGCARTVAACKAFDNLAHFFGFPWVPTRNPFTTGI